MHLYRCVDKLFQTSESSASKLIGAVAVNLTSDIQIGRSYQKEILSTKCEKIVSSTNFFSLPSNFRTKIISMMIFFFILEQKPTMLSIRRHVTSSSCRY